MEPAKINLSPTKHKLIWIECNSILAAGKHVIVCMVKRFLDVEVIQDRIIYDFPLARNVSNDVIIGTGIRIASAFMSLRSPEVLESSDFSDEGRVLDTPFFQLNLMVSLVSVENCFVCFLWDVADDIK